LLAELASRNRGTLTLPIAETGSRNATIPKARINLDRFLPYRIHRLAARLGFDDSFSTRLGTAVRVREWRVIALLAALGPMSSSEIASLLDMDAATVSRAIATLTTQKMAQSNSDKDDARRTITQLTALGATVHDEMAPSRVEFARSVEGCLSAPEQVALYALLDKLDARMDELRRIS
jgi:DNA-binding MarR family transcriptional regulator